MVSSARSGTFIVYAPRPAKLHRSDMCGCAIIRVYVLGIHAFTCHGNHKRGAPTYATGRTRNSGILRATNFSNAAATPITETDLRVSLSIDVMATFEIPHGVI